MSPPTALEQKIRFALDQASGRVEQKFDMSRYGAAFHPSALSKADAVVAAFWDDKNPVRERRPVVVSIGGADGEELHRILTLTEAPVGLLLEQSHDLAEAARNRPPPPGKTTHVVQADAVTGIRTVMKRAADIVRAGNADCILVTCHAVLHELPDRGAGYRPGPLFGAIFEAQDLPIWFTYREPGAIAQWPNEVIVTADCSAGALLDLATAICARHQVLRALAPAPYIMGDGVALHKDVAMETLAKLFYVDDLAYEIQERSTSVDHQSMKTFLTVAIGDTALREDRGAVSSSSAPTTSFAERWRAWRVRVVGIDERGGRSDLGLPESQTRVVAWRTHYGTGKPNRETHVSYEITLADGAITAGDDQLVTALVVSRGRSWIERDEREQALTTLRRLRDGSDVKSLKRVWSHYLLALSDLFSGRAPNPNTFSEVQEKNAEPYGLGILFRAERMEQMRKSGDREGAAALANEFLRGALIKTQPSGGEAPLVRYGIGTSLFVLGNVLRCGGLYPLARSIVAHAEGWFVQGIESHDVERLHCLYARSVCAGMRSEVELIRPFEDLSDEAHRFAGALIQLSYSNAAWFADDIDAAERSAREAADTFRIVGATQYVQRARTVAALARAWKELASGREATFRDVHEALAGGVSFLAGQNDKRDEFLQWFKGLRPSTAAGVLQFRRWAKRDLLGEAVVVLPQLLVQAEDGTVRWITNAARDLDDAERQLRMHIGAPSSRRIPLLAD